MAAVAFGTLKLARKLRDTAKMPQEQAEGIADALAEAMSGAELATKRDLSDLQAAIAPCATKTDLAATNAELAVIRGELAPCATKTDLAEARTEILRWLFAAVVAQTALIVTLIKLIH